VSKLVYWELPCTDTQRCARFYADLFGWTVEEDTDEYQMIEIPDGAGGGLYRAKDVPHKHVILYFGVDDIPSTLARAASLGGRIAQEKTEIGGDFGFWGAFDDPCGCRVGLWSND